MTTHDKTWETARDNYLRQVKEALAAAKYPGSKSILDEVRQHLEQRYAELPAEKRNWESYQAIISEMGPPSDYAELLGVEKLKRRLITWRRVAIWVPLALIILIVGNFFGIIPLTFYNGPKVYTLPGAPEEPPFVTDAQFVGEWISVDWVKEPSQFTPGQRWAQIDLWVKGLSVLDGGTARTNVSRGSSTFPLHWRWTKDWIFEIDCKIWSQYAIKTIGGETYLFFPWVSGDVTNRWMRPGYYVLKKTGT